MRFSYYIGFCLVVKFHYLEGGKNETNDDLCNEGEDELGLKDVKLWKIYNFLQYFCCNSRKELI